MDPAMLDAPITKALLFWVFCFGTFMSIFAIALVLAARIVTKRGDELREQIKLQPKSEYLKHLPDDRSKLLLEEFHKETVGRGNASLFLVARFTEYHYIAILSALASGTLVGVATFLISSIGWNGANDALKGFFIGCAGSLSFWITATQVFKYQETIAKHEAIYTACCNLSSEILEFVLSPQKCDDKNLSCDRLARFSSIAKSLEGIRRIGITFDGSKIGVTKIDLPK